MTMTDDDLLAYLAVCDELNDGNPNDVTLDELDADLVAAARRYAQAHERSWPPAVGDLDRAYEDGLMRGDQPVESIDEPEGSTEERWGRYLLWCHKAGKPRPVWSEWMAASQPLPEGA